MRRGYYGHSKKRKKTKKRDWHRSEFNNPYFTKLQPINLKPYLYFLLVSAITLIFGYIFLFSNYWRISSVVIEGKNQLYKSKIYGVVDGYLNKKVFNVLNGANYFLVQTKDIREEIEENFLVKDLVVDKKFPNKVVINFEKIEPAYIWIQNDAFYNVAEDGMILDEIVSVQPEVLTASVAEQNQEDSEFRIDEIIRFLKYSTANLDLPIIYNEGNTELKTKDYIANEEVFQYIVDLNTKIIHQVNIDVILYKIDIESFVKIEVLTEDGWKIYFDPQDDLERQLDNLYSLMEATFKDVQPLEYIDLRYGNKVYYR